VELRKCDMCDKDINSDRSYYKAKLQFGIGVVWVKDICKECTKVFEKDFRDMWQRQQGKYFGKGIT